MTGRFKLDPIALDGLADDLRAVHRADYQSVLQALSAVDAGLSAAWRSEGGDRFQAQFGDWVGRFGRLSQDLVAVEVFLRACVGEYRRLKSQRARALRDGPDLLKGQAASGGASIARADVTALR